MTTEEKAKAYDEAIERAKSKIKNDKDHVLYEDDIIEIFPELKESKGEEIRKELICFLETEIPQCAARDKYVAWLKKQGEQKTDKWSKEDETMLNCCLGAVNTTDYFDEDNKDKMKNWLMFIKDKAQPQPKQEWSEEDEYRKRQICRILKNSGCSQILQDKIKEWLENRFKSLKPQNRWKPSDEQMEYLAKAIATLGDEGNCKTASILNDLRVDLKKLK